MTEPELGHWARDLIRDEGTGPIVDGRLMPYRDSVGLLTIGYGRCIELRGISRGEASVLLTNDQFEVVDELAKAFPWALSMSPIRQRVLASLLFNLGLTKLLKFKTTLAAMQAGDYAKAAAGMRKSLWYEQVGQRGERLARQMEAGA